MKTTPREKLKKLSELNGNDGFYGTHRQFANLIEQRLSDEARKIMSSLNTGFLWSNERIIYNEIYDLLLDSTSTAKIKKVIKTKYI